MDVEHVRGAGVVVGHLSRALKHMMDVEVRCWGAPDRDDGALNWLLRFSVKHNA